MKHVTYSDKSLLVGDEAADMLLRYAALLANHSQADTVEVRALSPIGDEVVATFLLDVGAPLMAETTSSHLPEPDNATAVEYMKERMKSLLPPRPVAEASLPDVDELQL